MPLPFKPHHLNAIAEHFQSNQGLGPYVFLTGSDERAQQISQHFSEVQQFSHPRQHHFYLGKLPSNQGSFEVAAISTGMGGGSADIIINELLLLGAKRLLRIGTAGSLQPQRIKTGDIVVATAAVRDDKASWDYIYKEFPAIASMEYVIACQKAQRNLPFAKQINYGIIHSKSALYAREYKRSLLKGNEEYMQVMHKAGVLATEMECAQLFTLNSLYDAELKAQSSPLSLLCGAILAIVGDTEAFSNQEENIKRGIANAIQLGLAATTALWEEEAKLS